MAGTAQVLPKRAGRGVIITTNRWKRDTSLLRRFFPNLYNKVGYFITGLENKKQHLEYMEKFLHAAKQPLFRCVEIETHNRCNGKCAFCPVSSKGIQRPYARMSDDVFTGIISSLQKMKFSGDVSLYSNNEPLMDPRLPEFASLARTSLPGAYIKIYTNGLLLTVDIFRKLMPHLNRININQYGDSCELRPNIKEVYDFCNTEEGRRLMEGKTLNIQPRYQETVLSSRAGNAPNRKAPSAPIMAACLFPFTQFIIRPDGKVSLCCNDALGQMTMGDVTKDSLRDIWHNSAFTKVRKSMFTSGRADIPICAVCDFVR